MQGKRIGFFGPSWRGPDFKLTKTIQLLYDAAIAELTALGAEVVRDPFPLDTFANASDVYSGGFAAAGFDFSNYIENSFGIESFAEFVDIVGTNPATPEGPLNFIVDVLPTGPDGEPDASIPPDLTAFRAAQEQYGAAFNATLDELQLDALVYPSLSQLQVRITMLMHAVSPRCARMLALFAHDRTGCASARMSSNLVAICTYSKCAHGGA